MSSDSPAPHVALRPDLFAHPSGALWLPASRTAIVADAHLGYSWAQRRRGELGPIADFRAREKLFRLCDELAPLEIVFLGDLVHAPRPCAPEREWIEETLTWLAARTALIAVRGNHDRAFAREFGHLNLRTLDSWSNASLTAAHGDRFTFSMPEHHTLVLGHFHPCLGIRDAAGATQKLPLFLAASRCIVLPAFSPFARGYDLASGLPQELAAAFGSSEIAAFALTSTRVVKLGPLHKAVARVFKGDVSAPERFRYPPKSRKHTAQ